MVLLLWGAAMSGDWPALVASRLCHDLVSPLGAVGNGVELLRMTQADSPELALMTDAVADAQARLRLFRLAFGAAPKGQQVDAETMALALAALGTRVACHVALPESLPRSSARRLALASLCAETALAWGGDLHVVPEGISAAARRLKLEPPLWEALAAGRPPAVTEPATVHFALLADGGAVRVQTTETTLAIML